MPYETIVGRLKEDLEKFGPKATGYIGKHIVGTGEDTHLTTKVSIDLLRPHIILVCGKRGCVTEDTLIFTDKGFKPIKEFNSLKEKIYTYNFESDTFEWSSASLMKYSIDEELYEIKLQDGRRLVMTKEHPLLSLENGSIKWKRAEEMKIDDKLIVNLKVPDIKNDKESIRIARLLGFILADGSIYVKKGRWKDGRGYWYNGTLKRLRIFNADDNIIKQAKEDLEIEFEIKVRIEKRKSKDKILQTKQSKVVDKFIELGVPTGRKAGKIQIPRIIWESSNRFKANFLKALISCDGFVSKKGYIAYYSKSKKFLEDLQLLLSHFNILSTLKPKIVKLNGKPFKNYILHITDQLSIEKLKKIGLIHSEKNKRLKNHRQSKYKLKKGIKFLTKELCCLKIKKIQKINGIKKVYDLNVPKTHSFLANGIVSHNSGKSYSAAVIAEEIAQLPDEFRKRLAVVMIDTMGIFWSLKIPNKQQSNLLKEWDIKPKGFENVKVFVPFKQVEEFKKAGIPVDGGISISPFEFSSEEWRLAFNLSATEPAGIALEKNVNELLEIEKRFTVEDLITKIKDDRETPKEIKDALENMLTVANQWGVFGIEGIDIDEIVKPGQISVIDVSRLRVTEAWSVRNLLVAIIAKRIYQERVIARKEEEVAKLEGREIEKTFPMVWLIVDEAHQFIPVDLKTVSSEPFLTIAKQGREPGISLVAITQMPSHIHQDVLSQCDLVISHRLTSKADLDALYSVMQVYMKEELWKHINNLPRWIGSCIILDDNLEKVFSIQIRPKMSHHAGGTAIMV